MKWALDQTLFRKCLQLLNLFTYIQLTVINDVRFREFQKVLSDFDKSKTVDGRWKTKETFFFKNSKGLFSSNFGPKSSKFGPSTPMSILFDIRLVAKLKSIERICLVSRYIFYMYVLTYYSISYLVGGPFKKFFWHYKLWCSQSCC